MGVGMSGQLLVNRGLYHTLNTLLKTIVKRLLQSLLNILLNNGGRSAIERTFETVQSRVESVVGNPEVLQLSC